MIMIGADPHKRTHTVVAVDEVGRRLAEKTVRTNSEGHLELLAWSRRLASSATEQEEVKFALEDCRHLTRRLEADLLAGGARVMRVPTRLMAEARKVGREPGKSDPIDAQAVALAALRHPELPVAELDGPGREVKLLSGYDLMCRSGYDLMCWSRRGDHGMGLPPVTRVRRSLSR
jgi:transposase